MKSEEKDKYEIPEELKGIPMEQWTDDEHRRWAKQWSMYEGCQQLKKAKHDAEVE